MKKSILFTLSMLAFVGGTAYSFQMTVNNKSNQILQVQCIANGLDRLFVRILKGESYSFESPMYPITTVKWKGSLGTATVSIPEPIMQMTPILGVTGTFDISGNDASSYSYNIYRYANSGGTQRAQIKK